MRLTENILCLLCIVTVLMSCGEPGSPEVSQASRTEPLFRKVADSVSGVDFLNSLEYDEEFNIFTYRNFYNGGGVGLGDVNNDGLADIYFVGNQKSNRLYLNKGDFRFEDVTERAGVAGSRAWSTGVSMADINGDGWLDIYVCNSGDVAGDNKQNELFINNGDGTFSEQAEAYGLADQGYSTHAAFFDYDRDGDLDVYLLNNSYQAIGSFNLMQNIRPERDPVGGDKLYRNDGGTFTDVSQEAGIYGSVIGFGLGVSVGDVNQDGWFDIFVSNDFFERDYLYINNGDGTFSEKLQEQMRSISAASMGADMADINNDGYVDIFVTDMLPEPLQRMKQVTTFENWDKHTYNARNSYHYQYTRNMLHLNNGDGTFSEIGRLAGVSATDWSWGALFFDMDNDGRKDIFVANGIYQDLTDLDYLNFIQDDETKKKIITPQGVDYRGLIDPMPVNPVANYAFHNEGDLNFTNRAGEWGLGLPVHSNGSAYGDLDNDGDLDLVVNNVNAVSDVFENRAEEVYPDHHYLKIRLKGKGMNTAAFGARIWIQAGDEQIYLEQMPVRGFESTMESVITAGLGLRDTIDYLRVAWPDQQVTERKNVRADQLVELSWAEAGAETRPAEKTKNTMLTAHTEPVWSHRENDFVDFDRDRLLYHMRSNEGPAVAEADVNGDGLQDFYVGGAMNQPGVLLIQQPGGSFRKVTMEAFEADQRSEDVTAVFFDADQDGDPDLYVGSGGNEFGYGDLALRDRLYLNNGGTFSKIRIDPLSRFTTPTAVVLATDYDGDGDQDILTFERLVPFDYGLPAAGHVFENRGNLEFADVTEDVAPGFRELGLITGAVVSDYDGDNDQDVILVGEWMAPQVIENRDGKFVMQEEGALAAYRGWYSSIAQADLDNDGDMDYILGNHGRNTRFKTSPEYPVTLYVNDFDRNGAIEHIMAKRQDNGIDYPYTLKHDLVMQIPSLKKKYLKYESYNGESITDIFTPAQLEGVRKLEFNFSESAIMVNQGNGNFSMQPLPTRAQFAPVYAIAAKDMNGDGLQDLILGGNQYRVKPEAGRYDAGMGLVLLNRGDLRFEALTSLESGLKVDGEIRKFYFVESGQASQLWVFRNNDIPVIYE